MLVVVALRVIGVVAVEQVDTVLTRGLSLPLELPTRLRLAQGAMDRCIQRPQLLEMIPYLAALPQQAVVMADEPQGLLLQVALEGVVLLQILQGGMEIRQPRVLLKVAMEEMEVDQRQITGLEEVVEQPTQEATAQALEEEMAVMEPHLALLVSVQTQLMLVEVAVEVMAQAQLLLLEAQAGGEQGQTTVMELPDLQTQEEEEEAGTITKLLNITAVTAAQES